MRFPFYTKTVKTQPANCGALLSISLSYQLSSVFCFRIVEDGLLGQHGTGSRLQSTLFARKPVLFLFRLLKVVKRGVLPFNLCDIVNKVQILGGTSIYEKLLALCENNIYTEIACHCW